MVCYNDSIFTTDQDGFLKESSITGNTPLLGNYNRILKFFKLYEPESARLVYNYGQWHNTTIDATIIHQNY